MKLKSLILTEQRAAFQTEIDALLAKAQAAESRSLENEDMQKLKTLAEQRDALTPQIAAELLLEAESLRSMEARNGRPNGGNPIIPGAPQDNSAEQRDFKKMRRTVSMRAIIAAQAEGKALTGLEAEIAQEGRNEMLANKRSPEGIAIPGFMIRPLKPEQRAQSVGTTTQSGYLVATEIGEVIEYLYPKTVLETMGATMWTGLSSNVDLIRQNGAAAATWEGENDDNANTDPTVESVPMRPKRLGAQTIIGKQLVFQSKSISVENWIRNNLNTAQGIAVETAGLNGSGSAPIPEGILNASIGDVAIGTNGGAATWAKILELESTIADANAEYGNLAYLTTAPLRGNLKNVKKDAGSGEFVWANNEMNGYRAFISTVLPKTLTKGSSSDCHPIIFANWNELYIAQWDGLDIVVDPYTNAKKAQLIITVNGWYDVALRHLQSFAAIQDARNV